MCHINRIIISFVQLFLCKSIESSYQQNDKFHEELLIKPLASGHVYSYFQFTTVWNKTEVHNTCK